MSRRIWLALLIFVGFWGMGKAQAVSDLLNLGWDQIEMEDFKAALATADKVLAIYPESSRGLQLRGSAYANLGNYRLAMKDLNFSLEGNDDDASGYLRRCNAYYLMGDFEKAKRDVARALDLRKDFVEAYQMRAAISMVQKDSLATMADFDKMIKIDPSRQESFFLRGHLHYQLNEDRKAMDDFKHCIDHGGKRTAEAWNYLGVIAERQNDPALAAINYKKSAAAQHDFYYSYSNLGKLAYDEGKYEIAIRYFEQAIQIDSTSAFAYAEMARCLMGLDRHEEVLPLLATAIATKGKGLHTAYRERAVAEIELKQLQAAVLDCDSAIFIKADYPEAYFTRGKANEDLLKLPAAKRDYKKAYALAPKWDECVTFQGLTSPWPLSAEADIDIRPLACENTDTSCF